MFAPFVLRNLSSAEAVFVVTVIAVTIVEITGIEKPGDEHEENTHKARRPDLIIVIEIAAIDSIKNGLLKIA